MQIKTTMTQHLIPARMAVIKNLQTINAGEGAKKKKKKKKKKKRERKEKIASISEEKSLLIS